MSTVIQTESGDSLIKAPPGKKRSTASKNAIISATYEMLVEQGFKNLTIEGVAARAGVGKATIYRWWPSKGALAVEAFLIHVTPSIDYTSTGSARRDIGLQMRRLVQAFAGPSGRIVREMLATGQFEDETLEMFKKGFLEPRRLAAKKILLDGVEQGEFKPDFDTEIIIDALYGPIHHRLMTRRDATDEVFLCTLERMVLDTIAQ